MDAGSAVYDFFTNPTYDLPLAIAIGFAAGVSGWLRYRSVPLPPLEPRPRAIDWSTRPDTLAYVALEHGQYFPILFGLWQRLATATYLRFHVRIDSPFALSHPDLAHALPRPLALPDVVRDLARAYASAYWVENPNWLARQWPWLRRRGARRAAREFRAAISGLTVALPALESSGGPSRP